jgi:serralysin
MLIRRMSSGGPGDHDAVGANDENFYFFNVTDAPLQFSGAGPSQNLTDADGRSAIGGGFPDVVETADAAANTSTAYGLAVGQTARGTLSSGADHDFYAVNLVAGQTYTFALTGTGTNNVVDPYLRLYSTNGSTLLASDDDGLEGSNSIVTYTAGTSGTYYIDAASYNDSYAGQYDISVTAGTRASFDLLMGAGVIDTDRSWSATPGTGATVTYGFRQTTNGDSPNFSVLTAAEMTAVQLALNFWHEVAGINFSQVNPGGYTDNATMLFANYSSNDGAGAYAYYPGSTASSNGAGDVWLNLGSVSTTSLPIGSYSFFAIMHEIGHALGLSHPGLYNAGVGVNITYAANAQFVQDSQQYTVMSYFDETNTGARYNGYADTPLIFDIYALQQIYGVNASTRAGNTVYGFSSNAGTVYDFSQNTSPAFCIWDAAGTDELNCSGYSQIQLINLNEGTFSNVGGFSSNVSIALGATIENATGGSGADTIYGNSANNTIRGGGGNDTMDGAGGIDTAVFSGLRSAYTVTLYGGGSARVAGPDGTDTLTNFEYLQFNDQTISATNTAPVATINDHSLHTTTWTQVANWLSYFDLDGNVAVSYEFVDLGYATGSGQFWTPAGSYQAAGPTLHVAATDLANVWVGGATTTGTDTMWVRAYDGADWGNWDSFNFTATNTAPVATINDHSLVVGQWTQVQNWLSYSDAESDAATLYQFVDLGTAAGSGQFWTPAGSYQAAGPTLTVTAADLANVWVGGATNTGSDTMWVRAFDVASWSNWDSFNFTATANHAPTATIADHSVVLNQWTQAQNWLSYSDVDGHAATVYEFVDLGSAAGSGQFWTPAGGYQAAGPTLSVAAANLADVWVGGATTASTDNMWVRAYDGFGWSSWDPFTLTSHA